MLYISVVKTQTNFHIYIYFFFLNDSFSNNRTGLYVQPAVRGPLHIGDTVWEHLYMHYIFVCVVLRRRSLYTLPCEYEQTWQIGWWIWRDYLMWSSGSQTFPAQCHIHTTHTPLNIPLTQVLSAQSFVIVALFCCTALCLHLSVLPGVVLFLQVLHTCTLCSVHVAPWSWRNTVSFHCVLYHRIWLKWQ